MSGSAVYLTGYVNNSLGNVTAVTLADNRPATTPAATVPGVSSNSSYDLLLARYTGTGPGTNFDWEQVGGGSSTDQGVTLALSGQQAYVGATCRPPPPSAAAPSPSRWAALPWPCTLTRPAVRPR